MNSAKKRDKVKVSIAITSSFVLFSLFGCTTRIYFVFSLLSNLHEISYSIHC